MQVRISGRRFCTYRQRGGILKEGDLIWKLFFKSKKTLSKEISEEGIKPYPLIKNFSSEHFDISVDKKGLNKLYKLLTEQAQAGACLHKGSLKRPLDDEPRAFMSERANTTQLLVLDVDGLITSNPGDLQALADKDNLATSRMFPQRKLYCSGQRVSWVQERYCVYASILSFRYACTSKNSQRLYSYDKLQ